VEPIFGLIGAVLGVVLSELPQTAARWAAAPLEADTRRCAAARVNPRQPHLAAISLETALELAVWPEHEPRWADPHDWADHLAVQGCAPFY
jgi:hypothetical protein